MYDFNFFEALSAKGSHKETSNRSFIILSAILAVVLAAWPLFNLGYSYKLKKDTAVLKKEVTSDKKYPLLEQAKAVEEYMAQRNDQLKVLKDKDEELKNNEWLTEAFLFNITSSAPKDLKYNILAITPDKTIQIEGSAKNKPAVAELERSLRDSGRFRVLHVESIANEEGTYNFTMNLELKGGSEDEAN